jgi:hypothetical protein
VHAPPDVRRAPQEGAAHERTGSRLADEQRAGLGEGAVHGGVVQHMDQRSPEPVGEPAETPRKPLAKRVGVEHEALRSGSGKARQEGALAGPGHAGDQKHVVGGIAEDHVRRVQDGREPPVRRGSTRGEARLRAG